MEEFAEVVSVLRDVLASVRRLVRSQFVRHGAASFGRSTRSGRQDRSRTGLCRRDVFVRQKRGDEVGPTKRGKGTKVMLLVDGRESDAKCHRVFLCDLSEFRGLSPPMEGYELRNRFSGNNSRTSGK